MNREISEGLVKSFQIAVIPGDGIGPEVVAEAVGVVRQVGELSRRALDFRFDHFPWGSDFYRSHGSMMSAESLSTLDGYSTILFGAVGSPEVPDHISLWGLRLAICQGFDLYACIRPVHFYPGLQSSWGPPQGVRRDWIIVRENSEGEYSGVGGRQFRSRGSEGEVAVESSLYTETGCRRIMRAAFNLARSRSRSRVTCVTKSNAQKYGMVLWDDTFRQVAEDFPEVETDSSLVHAMAARMVLKPDTVDVIVASNLFGDILSDLGSAHSGSLGVAPSGNIDPERRHPSMFEPAHGSAPDIAGRGIANPVGAIASAAMMLNHLGLVEEAEAVDAAVAQVISGDVKTPDLGGHASTKEVGAAVRAALAAEWSRRCSVRA